MTFFQDKSQSHADNIHTTNVIFYRDGLHEQSHAHIAIFPTWEMSCGIKCR